MNNSKAFNVEKYLHDTDPLSENEFQKTNEPKNDEISINDIEIYPSSKFNVEKYLVK